MSEPTSLTGLHLEYAGREYTIQQMMDHGVTYEGKPLRRMELHLEDGMVVKLDFVGRRVSIQLPDNAAPGESALFGQIRNLIRGRNSDAFDMRIEFECPPVVSPGSPVPPASG